MESLTEGAMKSNIKRLSKNGSVKPKAPPPAATPTEKKHIKHNNEFHTQKTICTIMIVSLLLGCVSIIIAAELHPLALPLLYAISISISLVAIYLLPKFKSVNIKHAKNMEHESLIILFVLFSGPIMAMFILTLLLFPTNEHNGGT